MSLCNYYSQFTSDPGENRDKNHFGKNYSETGQDINLSIKIQNYMRILVLTAQKAARE